MHTSEENTKCVQYVPADIFCQVMRQTKSKDSRHEYSSYPLQFIYEIITIFHKWDINASQTSSWSLNCTKYLDIVDYDLYTKIVFVLYQFSVYIFNV